MGPSEAPTNAAAARLLPLHRALSPKPPASLPPPEKWSANSFMVTFAFKCNIACTFCMVEDVLDVFDGTSYDRFLGWLETRPAALAGVKRMIFSGGEVTLSKELPRYVELARRIPGVEHVRIQTNATRLGDRNYLRSLVACGVDEYFVSFHAPDAALCDEITQQKGSFDKIVRGMEAIVEEGATLITNTAIVQSNFARLPEIVARVAPLSPKSMEFWNYWPRADEDGGRQHFARITDIRPHLLRALGDCVARGIPPAVKWFPRCLLEEFAIYQDDSQPPALIEDDYWQRAPDYACIYDGVCADSGCKPCAGLAHTYVNRYGWEQEVLAPRRTKVDAPLGGAGLLARSLLSGVGSTPSLPESDRAFEDFLGRLGLSSGIDLAGWKLVSSRNDARKQKMVALSFGRNDNAVEVRLYPTEPGRRCFARTRSFDVSYSHAGAGLEREVLPLMAALVAHLGARDPGGVGFPA